MDLALSTHLFVRHRLTTVWLERAWDAGFTAVEIFCARQHLDYRDKAQIGELGHWFRDSPLKLHSLHAPLYSDDCWGRTGPQATIDITEPVKGKRIVMVDEIKRALDMADVVPFKYLIQHLGCTGQEFAPERVDAAYISLEELRVFAAQRGVELLIENVPNALSTAERLKYFLNQTHLNLNFCFDTGHANMHSSVEEEYAFMAPRIRSTHLHDNNGTDDSHLAPGKGSIDWQKTMDLLKSRPTQYPLLLELKEPTDIGNPIDEAKSAVDLLTKYL